MSNDNDGFRGFHVTHEAYYARPGGEVEIMFGIYYDEGGTSHEMAFRWHDFGSERAPRLEVYDDGWLALAGFAPELLPRLAELDDANATPDEIKQVLLDCGFRDITKRERDREGGIMATKQKPTPKREVAVSLVIPILRNIYFYATNDALADFKSFGNIEDGVERDEYQVTVDVRYDFQEVLDYISNYG
jgi:hypothetical protein